MIDTKLEDCRQKISTLNQDDKLRIIYTWVKQDFINLKQFKLLLKDM